MRKAASHSVSYLLGIIFITTLFIVGAYSASAYSVDSSKTSGDMDPSDNVSGSIVVSNSTATGSVTNNTNESIDVGIASYKKVSDDDLTSQEYFASQVVSVSAGETKSFSVEIPCWSQVDLFRVYGEQFSVLKSFQNGDRYAQRLLYAVHTNNECTVASASPSPTLVATPSATPVQTAEPSATPVETAQPTSEPQSDGRSDGLGCSVRDCSGNAIGGAQSTGSVAGASTSAILPSTGMFDYVYSIIAGFIATFGYAIRAFSIKQEKKYFNA